MALVVDDICTDGDLAALAGTKRLNDAKPSVAERNAVRQIALDEVVLALQGRTPPILEGDLTYPAELRDVVRLRALQILFQQSMPSADSLHGQLARQYGGEYAQAAKRSYTVDGGQRGPAGGTFRWERA